MYWTELMKKILTSPMAQKIVNEIAPVYGDAYVALWLFQTIGAELDEMEGWTADFKNQTLVQTATWTLPMWEERYGLPVNSKLTDEQRRQRIILRKSGGRTAMNPERLAKVASVAAGAEAEIEEFPGTNVFRLHFVNADVDTADIPQGAAAVRKAKQAHTIFGTKADYVIPFNISGLEQANLPRIFLRTAIPFWTCRLWDGTWLPDGSCMLDSRYQPYPAGLIVRGIHAENGELIENGAVGIGNLLAGNPEKTGLKNIDTRTEFRFWDGLPDSRDCGGALNMGAVTVSSPECFENAEVEARHNLWYLDGGYALDGSMVMDADIWKEAI